MFFFASVEISDEDKDYLTKEMLASDFSLLKNLTILNNFERKKSQIEFEANKDFFSQPLQLQSKEAIPCQLVEADISEEGCYIYTPKDPNTFDEFKKRKLLLIGDSSEKPSERELLLDFIKFCEEKLSSLGFHDIQNK